MDAYVFSADIYCEDCGVAIIKRLIREGDASLPMLDCRGCGVKLHVGRNAFMRYGKKGERFIGLRRALKVFESRNTTQWMECPDCGDEAMVFEDVDSNIFPAFASDGGGEADTVQHCGSHEKCINALEFDGTKVGVCLENALTSEGVDDLIEMVSEPNPSDYQKGLHDHWRQVYSWVKFRSVT